MQNKEIESQYNKMLAFNYGNNSKLIEQLIKSVKFYKNAKNHNQPKVNYRIELYTEIIKYANTK